MSNDIMRYMDDNKITLATIGGHGFGAKVATCTAINNMNRFTGVMCMDGGPLDHKYYAAYQELAQYIEDVRNLGIEGMNHSDAIKKITETVTHPKWRQIILQNLSTERGSLQWKCNMEGLYKNTKMFQPDVATWS
jgi:pimeloyl-ACP methyl ester carboxylesterase